MILVCGATGDLGGRIARVLVAGGQQVRALVRPMSDATGLQGGGIEVVRGDLRDPATLGAALAGIDTVVTTANAMSRILAGRTDLTIAAVDGEGTRNLIRAAGEAGVGRFVFVSIDGVSADSARLAPLMAAKWAAEINLEQDGEHQLICDMERDELHRETSRSQGALRSEYAYDPMGRLSSHRASAHQSPSSQVVVERAYQYDLAGNLVSRQDSLRGLTEFQYDPTGRILAARGRIEEFFAFDPAGNIQEPSASGPAPVTGNRLRVYQDLRFEYDEHGNVTQRKKGAHEEAHFEWGPDHQMAQATVTRHGVTQATRYEYDALGRRTRKSDAFGATEFLWDGDLMIESKRGNKEALFLFEPDSFVPLASVQEGCTYWYQCDQIGAPLDLTDGLGGIAWSREFKAWGEARLLSTGTDGCNVAQFAEGAQVPIVGQPFRLQGQLFDEETGLHYSRFRYYDPCVGRFVSHDPIGLLGGSNQFFYGENALAWVDPYGLKNTRELRKNMSSPCPKGYAAHHLIAEQLENHPVVAEAQKRGIYNINAGSNGVALPTKASESLASGKPLHSGNHLGTYYSAIQNQLDRITPQLKQLSDSDLLGKINGIENRTKTALEQDALRLQSTDPRTPETTCIL